MSASRTIDSEIEYYLQELFTRLSEIADESRQAEMAVDEAVYDIELFPEWKYWREQNG